MLRSLLVASVLCASVLGVPARSTPAHLDTTFNPRGKAHAVSRSTFWTEQGHVRDINRAYEGQGESHLQFPMANDVPLEKGAHLFEPAIYEQMQALAEKSLNSSSHLPSIEDAAAGVPEQVKISITQRAGEMVVNWLTWNTTATSTVMLGTAPGSYSLTVQGSVFPFVDPNSWHITRYIHNALVTNLQPVTRYYYVVGDSSSNVWSSELSFTTLSQGNEVMTVAIYGDMGVVNSVSMQFLAAEVAAGTVQAVLHTGDYAYNMDELQGMTGDVFLKEMQNITSAVPYMGTCGNVSAAQRGERK